MELKELCEQIELSPEIQEELLTLELDLSDEEISRQILRLNKREEWENARCCLKKILDLDNRGMKMLYCMLKAALQTKILYQEVGIPEEIYIATMKCFTRFTEEHKVSFGIYGFDRDFWTGRQLSLCLFRIGVLEYEKLEGENGKEISIHIPSDAVLTEKNVQNSLDSARAFFRQYDRAYENVAYTCESWLLSPVLTQLLPEDSKIVKFQNLFEITSMDKEAMDFMEWVYKRTDIRIEDLPEDTSLQRNMKKHLQNGGFIGVGKGVLV